MRTGLPVGAPSPGGSHWFGLPSHGVSFCLSGRRFVPYLFCGCCGDRLAYVSVPKQRVYISQEK